MKIILLYWCVFSQLRLMDWIFSEEVLHMDGDMWSAPGVLGPDLWKIKEGFEACGYSSQSPINLVKTKCGKGGLKLKGDDDVTGTLMNNGHSPTLKLDDSINVKFRVKVNVGKKYYKLEQFHFHFGCDDTKGSEHTVDGGAFSGELHFVFYDEKYGSFDNAVNKPQGLTVIGVLLKVGEGKENKELNKVVEKLSDIVEQGTSVKVDNGIEIEEIVDLQKADYYSYSGSLTTPPCYESVNWVVLKKPLIVSTRQIEQFRQLKSVHGINGLMCNNFRPIQATNGRAISLVNTDD